MKQERPLQVNRKTAYFVDNKVYRLGTVELDQEISVLEIQQKSSKDPRITLTKDAFKILDDNGIDNALVIFYSPDNTSYRLSLLTTKYADWDNKKTSSYKRYSYILWPGEKTKTPEKQLLNPIKDYDDLISRFDVEVVRKDFFEKYLELFVRLYKDIKKDNDFTDLLLSQKVDIVSFTKNLLWKIVFLYFIQQKGWLGLWHKEKEYGKGHKNFMRVMRDNFKNSGESMSTEKTWYFYNDYLERLFFAGLNVDRRDNDDWFPNLQMKVPYLNWWLFKEDYQWWEKYVTKITNDIFSNVDSKWDDADWILDVFDRYNFTIDEDSLYDSDIAVDPEMLGRIFEKMISISNDNIDEVVALYDNKGKKSKIDFWKELNKKLGAFYTPREIVHYMTKESLIAYLVNNIKWDKEQNEKLIRDLFELKEQFLLSKEDLTKTNFSSDIFDKLWWIIEQIDDALKKVKILDPAVWSWAFPMGLLHETSSIRYYIYGVFYKTFGVNIDEYKNEIWKISLYKIKREIILNNIYGVDIDPGAIDIARLRFWLSLVVDEDQPEPLPNFEFKFVCANTLIPLEEETKEKDLFAQWDEPKLETLKKYKREYYNASGNKEKRELKERIRDYTKIDGTLFSEPTLRAKQMAEFGANFDNSKHSHSFFDPSLMMSEWRGFDIVIGNPPYVNIYDINNSLKKSYSKYKTAFQKYDLYVLFYEKWIELLKQWWNINFITSNKFLSQWYWYELRKLFLKNKLNLIINFNYDIFDNATVRTLILLCEKSIPKDTNKIKIIDINSKKDKDKFQNLIYDKIEQNVFKETDQNNFRINLTEEKIKILEKIKEWNLLLEDICSINYWARVSSKDWSLWKDNFIYDYNNWNYKEYFEWKDLWSYSISKNVKFLNYQKELLYNPMFEELFENPKLVWLCTLSDIYKLRYNYDYKWMYCNHSIVIITLWFLLDWVDNVTINRTISDQKIKLSKKFQYQYLQSILNSKLIKFFVNELLYDWTHFYPNHMKQLPIKNISPEQQKPFIEKVDQILTITNQPWYDSKNPPKEQLDLEKEIDRMVYELYGLTDEEIKTVENSLK